MSTPQLTVLGLPGGDLAGKLLGPAPPQWHHPLFLPAGSRLAIEAVAGFYQRCQIQVGDQPLIREN